MKRSAILTAILFAAAIGVWLFGVDLAIDTIVGDRGWLVRTHAVLGVLASVIVYVVVSRQLRAQRRTEEVLQTRQGELAAQQATSKAIIDSSDGPIFSIDRNYCYTSFNSRHAGVMKMLYGAEIQIGHNLLDYHTNLDDRLLAESNLKRALDGESVVVESYAGADAHGRRCFQISHNPIRDSVGNVSGAAVFARDMTDHKRAQEQIEHLASFPRLNPNPILELDQHGKVTFFNTAAASCLREIGCGEETTLFLPPDLSEMLATVNQQGERKVFDREVRIKDRVFFENISVSGALNTVRIYATDITERKRAEEALRESRERERARSAELERVLDAVPAAVWIAHNTRADYITGNRLSYEWLRIPVGSNAFKSAREGERPETFRMYKDGMELMPQEMPVQRAAAGQEVRDYEFDFVYPDGSVRPVLGNATPLFDEAGNPCGSVSAFIDVTESKRTEKELRETRDYLEALINYANAPIIAWDQEFTITGFNKAFEVLTGRSAQDVIGHPLDILFPEESRQESYALIRLTQTGERWETVEIPILRLDGSVRTVVWNSATLYAPDGKTVTATIAQGQDITDRRQAEEELVHYMQGLEFIADTATDFLRKQTHQQVFEYIAQKVYELVADGYVIVSEYDPVDKSRVIRAFGGDQNVLRMISDTLGRELMGLRLPFDAKTREKIIPGTLAKMEEGIRCSSIPEFPEALYRLVEEKLGVHDLYAMPFVLEDDFLGTVVILTHEKDLGRNKRVIEGFVTQAAIVLNRLRTDEALRQREREYRTLMEEASDGIILVNSEGNLVAANSKASELSGYSGNELKFLHISDLVPSEDIPLLSERIKDIISGKTAIAEQRLHRKDGSRLYVETSARRLADGRYQAIFRDVTDRKKAEEEFTRAVQTEVFDKLFTALRELHHGEGLAMNLHRIALFARNYKELVTEPRDGDGTSSGKIEEPRVPAQSSPRARLEIAVREYVTVGHARLREIASLLRIVESDINQRAGPGEQPVSANDMFSRSDVLKADLEELLHTVQRHESGGADTSTDLGERIPEHVEAIFQIVAGVSRQLKAHYTSDVSEVVKAIVPSFQSSSADVVIDVRQESPDIKAIISPADLGNVLSILLTNSLEAPPGTGAGEKRIVVRSRIEETRARIEVEDNGGGVPEEVRGRMFGGGVTTKGSGHGHGLSFAQKRLRKYGGTLVYDEQYREGARFVIELVLA